MPEGGIYLCNWKKRKGEYFLDLQANPTITARGGDLEACKEDICMEIIGWNGDGEAILELFPPLTGKKHQGGAQLFVTVGYNNSVRAIDYATLFTNGVCAVCKHGLGARSDVKLQVETTPQGTVCGIDACYPPPRVYAKKFIAALASDEKSAFDVRPVIADGKESDYVEIIPHEIVSTVGYKGANYPTVFQQSFRCAECGREKFTVAGDGIPNDSDFIDARDIDGLSDSLIFVDDGWCAAMAFRISRWKEILSSMHAKGLSSGKLIVLQPDYVETPTLELVDQFDWVM